MTQVITEALSWVLIPMGVLPIITAVVLLPKVNSRSVALKERARLAQVLALLGLLVTILAANRVFALNMDLAWVLIFFILVLLAIDVASGIWLYLYVTGRFGRG